MHHVGHLPRIITAADKILNKKIKSTIFGGEYITRKKVKVYANFE